MLGADFQPLLGGQSVQRLQPGQVIPQFCMEVDHGLTNLGIFQQDSVTPVETVEPAHCLLELVRVRVTDRHIAGGNSIVVDQEAADEADVLIPRTETFRVRVGPGLRNATSLTSTYVESWYRYFLLPRRPSLDARWIICYGCDTSELGSYQVLWRDNNGISIGRRR